MSLAERAWRPARIHTSKARPDGHGVRAGLGACTRLAHPATRQYRVLAQTGRAASTAAAAATTTAAAASASAASASASAASASTGGHARPCAHGASDETRQQLLQSPGPQEGIEEPSGVDLRQEDVPFAHVLVSIPLGP